jgi:hypothetical protein
MTVNEEKLKKTHIPQQSVSEAKNTLYNPILINERGMAGGNGVDTLYAFAFVSDTIIWSVHRFPR